MAWPFRVIPLFLFLTHATAQAGVFDSDAEEAEALTQQRTALKLEIEGATKVYATLYNLETAAVSLCGEDAAWIPGFAVATAGYFPGDLRQAATSLGYGRQARVMYVVNRSPAGRAGLTAGDIITAVDGREIPEGEDAHEAVSGALAAAKPGENVRVTIQNTPEDRRELGFALARACHFRPHLLRSHVVNAAASGDTLHITTGMLDFLDSDTELAAVLAHELAHSIMSHTAKRMGNQLLGKSLDTVLGAAAGPAGGLLVRILAPGKWLIGGAYSQDFEREADYVSMYVLALAGYRLEDAPRLWRKLAVEFPDMLEHSYLGTHPATAERVLLQTMTIAEIGAKVAAREPLLPEIERRLSEIKRGGE